MDTQACYGATGIPQTEELKVRKNAGYRFVKRTVDIVGSAVALLVASPIILGFAAAIYIDDPHASPFFCQPRVGKDGKEFRFWKLRSMVSKRSDTAGGVCRFKRTEAYQ